MVKCFQNKEHIFWGKSWTSPQKYQTLKSIFWDLVGHTNTQHPSKDPITEEPKKEPITEDRILQTEDLEKDLEKDQLN